ncbi:MAG: hypothetical protein NVS4B3_18030 [Gemmatimonadaceae bacterium]
MATSIGTPTVIFTRIHIATDRARPTPQARPWRTRMRMIGRNTIMTTLSSRGQRMKPRLTIILTKGPVSARA